MLRTNWQYIKKNLFQIWSTRGRPVVRGGSCETPDLSLHYWTSRSTIFLFLCHEKECHVLCRNNFLNCVWRQLFIAWAGCPTKFFLCASSLPPVSQGWKIKKTKTNATVRLFTLVLHKRVCKSWRTNTLVQIHTEIICSYTGSFLMHVLKVMYSWSLKFVLCCPVPLWSLAVLRYGRTG